MANKKTTQLSSRSGLSLTDIIRVVASGQSWQTTLQSVKDLITSSSTIVQSAAPTSPTSAGVAGTVTWDDSYIYVCVSTNKWRRSALGTW